MNFGRQFVISLLLTALLGLTGCAKKKPQLPPQAKSIDTVAVPLPDEISEASPPPPAPAPRQEAPPPEPPKQKPTTKKRQRKQAQPPPASIPSSPANSPAPASGASSNTLAAAHPPANPAAESTPDLAIAADVTSAQLNQQKQTTAQLLDATEKTLHDLNRPLHNDENEIVNQIRSYVTQSKSATAAGDFERAYNLANKAHLLSDALVKK